MFKWYEGKKGTDWVDILTEVIRVYNNQLLPAQLERLALLIEEMGETIQVVGKILRFGYNEGHPARFTTNKSDLEKELGHVMSAVARLQSATEVDYETVVNHQVEKSISAKKFLRHQ
jgi:NTP pyrophosphatase (non-canonical NTP hydrolase)